jgi:hypothetical protein
MCFRAARGWRSPATKGWAARPRASQAWLDASDGAFGRSRGEGASSYGQGQTAPQADERDRVHVRPRSPRAGVRSARCPPGRRTSVRQKRPKRHAPHATAACRRRSGCSSTCKRCVALVDPVRPPSVTARSDGPVRQLEARDIAGSNGAATATACTRSATPVRQLDNGVLRRKPRRASAASRRRLPPASGLFLPLDSSDPSARDTVSVLGKHQTGDGRPTTPARFLLARSS